MPTQIELQSEYDTLEQEKTQIVATIADIANEVSPIEEQIASLKSQATELDLKISETPQSINQKSCSCAFLCMGSSCSEYPVPNPEIANLINQRNPLIRESNELQAQIDAKGQEISSLTARQVEIQTRQNEIRGLLVSEQSKLSLIDGSNILGTVKEYLPYIKKYLPYILIGGGVLTLAIIIIKRR